MGEKLSEQDINRIENILDELQDIFGDNSNIDFYRKPITNEWIIEISNSTITE